MAGVLHGVAGETGQTRVRSLDQGHSAANRLHPHLTPRGEIHRPMHPGRWVVKRDTSNALSLKLKKQVSTESLKLREHSRLAAADTDGMQAGTLQTSVVHPALAQ